MDRNKYWTDQRLVQEFEKTDQATLDHDARDEPLRLFYNHKSSKTFQWQNPTLLRQELFGFSAPDGSNKGPINQLPPGWDSRIVQRLHPETQVPIQSATMYFNTRTQTSTYSDPRAYLSKVDMLTRWSAMNAQMFKQHLFLHRKPEDPLDEERIKLKSGEKVDRKSLVYPEDWFKPVEAIEGGEMAQDVTGVNRAAIPKMATPRPNATATTASSALVAFGKIVWLLIMTSFIFGTVSALPTDYEQSVSTINYSDHGDIQWPLWTIVMLIGIIIALVIVIIVLCYKLKEKDAHLEVLSNSASLPISSSPGSATSDRKASSPTRKSRTSCRSESASVPKSPRSPKSPQHPLRESMPTHRDILLKKAADALERNVRDRAMLEEARRDQRLSDVDYWLEKVEESDTAHRNANSMVGFYDANKAARARSAAYKPPDTPTRSPTVGVQQKEQQKEQRAEPTNETEDKAGYSNLNKD